MKHRYTKKSLVNGLIALIVITASCQTPEKQATSEPVEKVSVSPTLTKKQFYINSTSNESLAEIDINGTQINISTAKTDFFGILKKEDKRKYYDTEDQMRYAVKYSQDGFKLRDKNENLLWKIKIQDQSLKLANNEEMNESYKISFSGQGKIKVKKNDQEYAALRFNPEAPIMIIGEKYSLRNFSNSLSPGVFLIDEMEDEQKYLICAELLNLSK